MFLTTDKIQFDIVLKTETLSNRKGIGRKAFGRGPEFPDVFLFELGFSEDVSLFESVLEAGRRAVDEIEESVEAVVRAEVAGV